MEPGREPPPPNGPDTRTLEGLVEIAEAGPEVPGSLAAYWKAKLSDADPPIVLQLLKTTTGQSADVVYLSTDKGEPPAAVFDRFKRALVAGGDDDVRFRMLDDHAQAAHAYGTRVSQSYGMALARDGERQLYHGEIQVVVLDDGGAIGLNAFEPGPARGADPSSWSQLGHVLAELQTGIWPDQEGG